MQTPNHEPARTDFGLLLARAFNAYVEHLHDQLATSGFLDLRPTFGLPLRALHREPRTLSELGVELGVSKQAAAKVVGELERRGLIERTPSPADGRATLLHLSPSGRSLVATAIDVGNQVEQDLAREIGDAAAADLRLALERLAFDAPWTPSPGSQVPARRVW
jgi:DNA-binding MarR family transcriptional regulator